jgi:branched-chain amino acid transport system substrate-binding protein
MPPTFTAWEKWTNAHGGVDGHPVNVILDDDGGAVATSITDVRGLVAQHVPVLVDVSVGDSGWAAYAATQKEPVITDIAYIYNNYFFASGPTLSPYQGIGSFAVAKTSGATKFAFLYCADVSGCTQAVPSAKVQAKEAGVSIVYAGAVAASAPSYAANCEAAKAAGANAISVFGPVSLQVAVNLACIQEGDKFIIASSSFNFSNYWLKYPSLNGAVEDDPAFPVAYDGNAAAQAYHAAMKQYEPSEASNVNYGEANAVAWVSMQEAAQALVNANVAKTATPTSQDVLNGLYKMDGNTLGGLAVPLTFTATSTGQDLNCWFTMAIKNQQFIAPDGIKTSCYTGSVSS